MKKYNDYLDKITLVREPSQIESHTITSSDVAQNFLEPFFDDVKDVQEKFVAVFLNKANKTVGVKTIGTGGRSGVMVDVAIIAKYALDTLCSGVIVCHNHPSGNLKPSKADLKITKELESALKLFKISLLDHLILVNNSHLSFSDKDLI